MESNYNVIFETGYRLHTNITGKILLLWRLHFVIIIEYIFFIIFFVIYPGWDVIF
jgi:hypothetical protein